MLPARVIRVVHIARGLTQRDIERGKQEQHEADPQDPAILAEGGHVEQRDRMDAVAGRREGDAAERGQRNQHKRQSREQQRNQQQTACAEMVRGGHGDCRHQAKHQEQHAVDRKRFDQRAHEATSAVRPTPSGGEDVTRIARILCQRVAGQRTGRRQQKRHAERAEGYAGKRRGSGIVAVGTTHRHREDGGEDQQHQAGQHADDQRADDARPLETKREPACQHVCAERGADRQCHAGQSDRQRHADVRGVNAEIAQREALGAGFEIQRTANAERHHGEENLEEIRAGAGHTVVAQEGGGVGKARNAGKPVAGRGIAHEEDDRCEQCEHHARAETDAEAGAHGLHGLRCGQRGDGGIGRRTGDLLGRLAWLRRCCRLRGRGWRVLELLRRRGLWCHRLRCLRLSGRLCLRRRLRCGGLRDGGLRSCRCGAIGQRDGSGRHLRGRCHVRRGRQHGAVIGFRRGRRLRCRRGRLGER